MRIATITAVALLLTSCGSSGNLLDQYPLDNQTLAVVVTVPESPVGRAVKADSWSDSHEPARVPVTNPVVSRREHIQLQDQLDEALLRIDTAQLLSLYALEQSAQLLDVETTEVAEEAGLVLDVKLRLLDAEAAQSRAHIWMDATGEARLIDRATGRIVWHMPLNTTPRRTTDMQNPAVSVLLTDASTRTDEELISLLDRLCDVFAQYIVRQLERDYEAAASS
ncbi:MAG: hypothetical protein AAF730_10155 [Bacteroidota bacterium]